MEKTKKVIDFVAEDYIVCEDVPDNKSQKVVFTKMPKHSCLGYELGDWSWSWSQIYKDYFLEPDTEYILRFAVYGGYNDTQDATLQCSVCFDGDWEERKNFELAQYGIEAVLRKRCCDNILRVYEIPFTTKSTGKVSVVFAAMHAVADIMPAFTNESYAEMDDTFYEEWWSNRQEYLELAEKNRLKARKRRVIRIACTTAAVCTAGAILLHKKKTGEYDKKARRFRVKVKAVTDKGKANAKKLASAGKTNAVKLASSTKNKVVTIKNNRLK